MSIGGRVDAEVQAVLRHGDGRYGHIKQFHRHGIQPTGILQAPSDNGRQIFQGLCSDQTQLLDWICSQLLSVPATPHTLLTHVPSLKSLPTKVQALGN
jgi:hypothetical protein